MEEPGRDPHEIEVIAVAASEFGFLGITRELPLKGGARAGFQHPGKQAAQIADRVRSLPASQG